MLFTVSARQKVTMDFKVLEYPGKMCISETNVTFIEKRTAFAQGSFEEKHGKRTWIK